MKEAYFTSEFYAGSQSGLRVFRNSRFIMKSYLRELIFSTYSYAKDLKNVWYVVLQRSQEIILVSYCLGESFVVPSFLKKPHNYTTEKSSTTPYSCNLL